MAKETVNHPPHYNEHPAKIECIEVIRYFNFDIGNAIKYLWRQGLKQEEGLDPLKKQIDDCRKAIWYINDHIAELEKQQERNRNK